MGIRLQPLDKQFNHSIDIARTAPAKPSRGFRHVRGKGKGLGLRGNELHPAAEARGDALGQILHADAIPGKEERIVARIPRCGELDRPGEPIDRIVNPYPLTLVLARSEDLDLAAPEHGPDEINRRVVNLGFSENDCWTEHANTHPLLRVLAERKFGCGFRRSVGMARIEGRRERYRMRRLVRTMHGEGACKDEALYPGHGSRIDEIEVAYEIHAENLTDVFCVHAAEDRSEIHHACGLKGLEMMADAPPIENIKTRKIPTLDFVPIRAKPFCKRHSDESVSSGKSDFHIANFPNIPLPIEAYSTFSCSTIARAMKFAASMMTGRFIVATNFPKSKSRNSFLPTAMTTASASRKTSSASSAKN